MPTHSTYFWHRRTPPDLCSYSFLSLPTNTTWREHSHNKETQPKPIITSLASIYMDNANAFSPIRNIVGNLGLTDQWKCYPWFQQGQVFTHLTQSSCFIPSLLPTRRIQMVLNTTGKENSPLSLADSIFTADSLRYTEWEIEPLLLWVHHSLARLNPVYSSQKKICVRPTFSSL